MNFRAVPIVALISCLGQCPQINAQTKGPVEVPENQAPATTQIQITEKPLPTVKEAIAKAIDHTKAHQLFLNKSIEIAAAKEPDGTVKVVFSRPTSDIIEAEGRLPVKPIVAVRFTQMDVPATQPEKMGQAELQERADALAKAVRAVCSRLAVADKMEFAVRAAKDDGGFSVLVERIPYTPGAHTLYQISSDFEVVNVFSGR
ncbi:MAG: hypothetical protein ACREHD_19070 [Pirellulales bacterium]